MSIPRTTLDIFERAREKLKKTIELFLKSKSGILFTVRDITEKITFPKLGRKLWNENEYEWEVADALEMLVKKDKVAKKEFRENTYYGIK